MSLVVIQQWQWVCLHTAQYQYLWWIWIRVWADVHAEKICFLIFIFQFIFLISPCISAQHTRISHWVAHNNGMNNSYWIFGPFGLSISSIKKLMCECSSGRNLVHSIKSCQNDPIAVEKDCFLFPWQPHYDNFNISVITYIVQIMTEHTTKLCNWYLQYVTRTSKESLHNVSVTSPAVLYFCVLKYSMFTYVLFLNMENV